MPITPHIEAEAKRAIEEVQDYYRRFSDDINDTDEMEHRISRIERLKEACNGLTDKDKLQKTAENLFEVGTAWERGQDMIKKIIKRNQANVERQLENLRKENNENFENIQSSIKDLSDNINKKFDEEHKYNEDHYETKAVPKEKESGGLKGMILRFLDNHFVGCVTVIILLLVMLFVSGHIELINQLLSKL